MNLHPHERTDRHEGWSSDVDKFVRYLRMFLESAYLNIQARAGNLEVNDFNQKVFVSEHGTGSSN